MMVPRRLMIGMGIVGTGAVQSSVNAQNQNGDESDSSSDDAHSLETSASGVSDVTGVTGVSRVTKSSHHSSTDDTVRQRDEDLVGASVTTATFSKNKLQLFEAIKQGRVQDVKEILRDQEVDVDELNQILISAAEAGRAWVVEILADDRRVDLNKVEEFNHSTPLLSACANNHEEVVRVLLERDLDINQGDSYGWTPFYIACKYGFIPIVQMLLADNRIDVNKPRNNGRTPFYRACKAGKVEVVRMLLADPRVNVVQANHRGCTPLQTSICESNDQSKSVADRQRYAQIVQLLQNHLNNL